MSAPADRPADQAYYWTAEWQASEAEAEADLRAGRSRVFPDTGAAITYLTTGGIMSSPERRALPPDAGPQRACTPPGDTMTTTEETITLEEVIDGNRPHCSMGHLTNQEADTLEEELARLRATAQAARALLTHVRDVHGPIAYKPAETMADGLELPGCYNPSGVMVQTAYLMDLDVALATGGPRAALRTEG